MPNQKHHYNYRKQCNVNNFSHSTGHGAQFTKGDTWALYTLVYGFEDDTTRKNLEFWLHLRINQNNKLYPWEVRKEIEKQVTDRNNLNRTHLTVANFGGMQEAATRRIARGDQQIYMEPPPQQQSNINP